MRRPTPRLLALCLACRPPTGAAFVPPAGRGGAAALSDMVSPATWPSTRSRGNPVQPTKRRKTGLASKEDDEAEEDEADDAPNTFAVDNVEEKREPSAVAQVTSVLFTLFSYTIQFLGAFFSVGLLLNLLGFGYTFDLDKGLVIDRIQNIRNEVQFEREIEREERMERKGGGGGPGGYIIAPSVPENDVGSGGGL